MAEKYTPEITVGGKAYPMNFSIKAAREVTDRFGDIGNLGRAFQGDDMGKQLEDIVWLLALLINQGIARRNLLDGTQERGVKAEDLEVLLDMEDLGRLTDELLAAITAGMAQEVELEPDPKNGETTQG